jgi:hypothetical protein
MTGVMTQNVSFGLLMLGGKSLQWNPSSSLNSYPFFLQLTKKCQFSFWLFLVFVVMDGKAV